MAPFHCSTVDLFVVQTGCGVEPYRAEPAKEAEFPYTLGVASVAGAAPSPVDRCCYCCHTADYQGLLPYPLMVSEAHDPQNDGAEGALLAQENEMVGGLCYQSGQGVDL